MATAAVNKNPSWEEVSETIGEYRKIVEEERSKKIASLSLIQYLQWVLQQLELVEAYANDYKAKIQHKILLYELTAKNKVHKEFEVLIEKQKGAGSKSKNKQHEEVPFDHSNDEQLFRLVYKIVSRTESKDDLIEHASAPFAAICERQTQQILSNISALAESYKKSAKSPLQYKNVAEAIESIINWKTHFLQLCSEFFHGNATQQKVVEAAQSNIIKSPILGECLAHFAIQQVQKVTRTPEDEKECEQLLNIVTELPSNFLGLLSNIVVKAMLDLQESRDSLPSIANQVLKLRNAKNDINSIFVTLSNLTNEYAISQKKNQLAQELYAKEENATCIPIHITMLRTVDVDTVINVPSGKESKDIKDKDSFHVFIQIPKSLKQVIDSVQFFEQQVHPCNKAKKVHWRLDHGSASMIFHGMDKQYTLIVSSYQLLLLLLLNENDGLTYKELKTELVTLSKEQATKNTQIAQAIDACLKAELKALCKASHGPVSNILEFHNKNESSFAIADEPNIEDETLFVVNDYFTSAETTVVFKNASVDLLTTKETIRHVFVDTKHVTQLCIVQHILQQPDKKWQFMSSKQPTYSMIPEKAEKMSAMVGSYTKPDLNHVNESIQFLIKNGFLKETRIIEGKEQQIATQVESAQLPQQAPQQAAVVTLNELAAPSSPTLSKPVAVNLSALIPPTLPKPPIAPVALNLSALTPPLPPLPPCPKNVMRVLQWVDFIPPDLEQCKKESEERLKILNEKKALEKQQKQDIPPPEREVSDGEMDGFNLFD